MYTATVKFVVQNVVEVHFTVTLAMYTKYIKFPFQLLKFSFSFIPFGVSLTSRKITDEVWLSLFILTTLASFFQPLFREGQKEHMLKICKHHRRPRIIFSSLIYIQTFLTFIHAYETNFHFYMLY